MAQQARAVHKGRKGEERKRKKERGREACLEGVMGVYYLKPKHLFLFYLFIYLFLDYLF